MSQYIFVTGGVVSSLGKGITAASIAMLLKARGLRVKIQKLDPYLNVDPGTMNPYQHGEVYVTDDGFETDLDLGHYERFTGEPTCEFSNYTSGAIYYSVITKERHGDYLGNTIQVIPHVTNEIKSCIRKYESPDVDVIVCELGGTVGDIEGMPFLEAIRQMGQDVGKENVLYIHLTLIPYIKAAQEMKTKPTQHSVGRLREIGIIPDLLICRTEYPISEEIRDKLALFCNVEKKAVIEEIDVKKSIYEVPFIFIEQELDTLILKKLSLPRNERDLGMWPDVLETISRPQKKASIAVVGKYSELQDAYKSIYEAIDHGGIAHKCEVNIMKTAAEEIEEHGADKILADADGILVPGGFGSRGIEGKIQAIQYARENKIPFFGICLGLQCAAIEFARNVCGLQGANTTEYEGDTGHPVICLLEEQQEVEDKGASMRLGAYPCNLLADSAARTAYGVESVSERHRHRYEFNKNYIKQFEAAGARFSGICPKNDLVEIFEIKDHPWFVTTQFHPEFKSYPVQPHPLFMHFVGAAIAAGENSGK